MAKSLQPDSSINDVAESIVSLGNMIAEQFSAQAQQFSSLKAEMRAGFDKLETRMRNLEDRVDKIEGRLLALENDVKELYDMILRLQKQVSNRGWDKSKEKKLAALEQRMDRLEEQVGLTR